MLLHTMKITNTYFLLLLLCICFLVIVITSQTCEEKSSYYIYGSISLTCTNGTRSFPNTNKSVSVITCLDCNIAVLNEETIIKNFRGENFNLSNSHVQIIGPNVFDTFPRTMRRFIFENNEIGYIAPKVFSNFSLLEELNFQNSRISDLDPTVFDATNVTVLDLSKNYLTNINDIFNGMKITKLNVSYNKIKEISNTTFGKITVTEGRGFSDFQHLDLSNNLIERIPPNIFKCDDTNNCFHLLDLNNNAITLIEENLFLQLRFVAALSLEGNLISQLYPNSFKGLLGLNILNLRNNRIEQIPVSLFADLQNLDDLDLSQNYINLLEINTFSGLRTLRLLNISHNNLQVLEYSHLFPLGQLKVLDISDTRIHDFKITPILEHHTELDTLILNDNFWLCEQLLEIYKKMNRRFRGFNYPSHHFDVPNIHGIACSRQKLKSYDNLSFDYFFNITLQDGLFEDWLDFQVDNKHDKAINDTVSSLKYIIGIHSILIVIIVIIAVLILLFIIKQILLCLHNNSMLSNNRLSFLYVHSEH